MHGYAKDGSISKVSEKRVSGRRALSKDVRLEVPLVEITEKSLRVTASVNVPGFQESPLSLFVEYPEAVTITDHDVANIVLAAFLPYMARFGSVSISLPVASSTHIEQYWGKYLSRINGIEGSFSIDYDFGAGISRSENNGLVRSESQTVALLFGGGVESLFALMKLAPVNPLLVALDGPRFLNNDPQNRVKLALEELLWASRGFRVHRVTTNVRDLFVTEDDSILNRLCTGAWLYHFLRPLLNSRGVALLFKSSEWEEAQLPIEYDTSLHARRVNDVGPENPILMPIFNSYSKAEMFLNLADSPFLDFLFSCPAPGAGRWCGACAKCGRIAEYARRFGVSVERIGLPADTPYESDSPVEELYKSSIGRVVERKSRENGHDLLGNNLMKAWLRSVVSGRHSKSVLEPQEDSPEWLDRNLREGVVHESDFKLLTDTAYRFGIETIIDIGASYGYSATSLRNLGFEGKILSVEPLSIHANPLHHLQEKWPGNFDFLPLAVSDREEPTVIGIPVVDGVPFYDFAFNCDYEPSFPHLAENLLSQTSAQCGRHEADFFFESSESISLDSLLDTVLRARSDQRIAVKVDTNGSEISVIKGGLKSLRAHKPLLFIAGARAGSELSLIIESLGYQECFATDHHGKTMTEQYNRLFVHDSWFTQRKLGRGSMLRYGAQPPRCD
jgi:FkbM family methyltransferase